MGLETGGLWTEEEGETVFSLATEPGGGKPDYVRSRGRRDLTWGICRWPRYAGKETRDFFWRDRGVLDSNPHLQRDL